MINIPFNKPSLTGMETEYIKEAVASGKISGNGDFTHRCQLFFEKKIQFKKCLLTTSCTDALEMAAILANIQPGDEVIMPSFTFVSTALAFIRQGAKIRFVDSQYGHPNMDTELIESLITSRTKAIIPVHYAGIACDMDKIMDIAAEYNLLVIEDAAQAIDSYYKGKPLGGIGHFGCFSFHETKNVQCGEGGMIAINDERFINRADIIWEKGTNRAAFFRGEIDKYGWIDTGSSFLPSEITAAFLYAQLENLEHIQVKRREIWDEYLMRLTPLASKGWFSLPHIPDFASNNAHMFYIVCNTVKERSQLIEFLKSKGIMAVFHYQSLHKSKYYVTKHDGRELPNSDRFSDCLVRLPLFSELSVNQVDTICDAIEKSLYFKS